jgi:predicted branched-subunit amino acid permease
LDRLRPYPGVPGLAFAVGVVLLVLAWRQWHAATTRTAAVVESVLTFLLVSIGLFWAVGDYSASVGVRRGYEAKRAFPGCPAWSSTARNA